MATTLKEYSIEKTVLLEDQYIHHASTQTHLGYNPDSQATQYGLFTKYSSQRVNPMAFSLHGTMIYHIGVQDEIHSAQCP